MKTVTYQQVKELAAQLAGRADDTATGGLKLSVSEATMLRTFFAAELPDLWNREAWPELCDHLMEVTLDDDHCFAVPYSDANNLTLSGAAVAAVNGEYTLGGDAAYPTEYYNGDYYLYYQTDQLLWYISADHLNIAYDNSNLTGTWVGTGTAPMPTVAYTEFDMGDLLTILTANPLATNVVQKAESWTPLGDRVNVLAAASTVWVDYQTAAPDLLDDDTVGTDINTYELPARFKLPLAARGAALLVSEEDPARAGVLRGLAESELQKQASRLVLPWWRKL